LFKNKAINKEMVKK